MTVHAIHPPILDAGLCDECPRCRELAADPTSRLDAACLNALWQVMLAVEFDHAGVYRSECDAEACRELYRIARFVERLGGNPHELAVLG